METAVNLRWLNDEKDVQDWILGILSTGITCVDLPIIARCMDAWSTRNPVDLQKWNQLCIASRDTAELRDEERQMGRALQKRGDIVDWREYAAGYLARDRRSDPEATQPGGA